MKIITKSVLCLAALFAVCCASVNAQGTSAPGDDQWPKTITSQDVIFKVYQPQIDSWDGFILHAHCAIGAQKSADENKVSYGVTCFTINTIVDKDKRLVKFDKLQIDSVKVPSQPEQEQNYLNILRRSAPLQMTSMSLDRLEANLAIIEEQEKGDSYELNNTPPKIIFSNKPAVLVNIDGEPAYTPVKGTSIARVLNTRVLLIKDGSGKYFLHVFDGYMEAPDINGPWKISKQPPADIKAAEDQAEGADLLEGESDQAGNKPSLSKMQAPQIFISKTPTELVVSDGEPNYVSIDGTKLLYVSNTSANIFRDMDDQKLYVLISGRWFNSLSEAGPWSYVPSNKLPEDFAKIPDKTQKENVKASVPGTNQAQEALIANSIPSTTKVDRVSAKLTLEMDGTPQLKPIEGTGLYYVFNCSIPVIKVNENSWFAVYNGVWYTAKDLGGPWEVADSVPAVIYSIPVKSPLHYVTYVKVYNSDAQSVYVGHTPGYYGTVVSADGTVVYGTGYLYPSYIGGSVWYSPMDTYGYGTELCWTPWYGWSYCFGFGWGFGASWYYPPFPYWGPFYVWRHNLHYGFHPWELSTGFNGYNRSYHREGAHRYFSDIGHFGRAYNSRTGIMVVGHQHAMQNVFKAGLGATRTGVSGQRVYGMVNGHVYRQNGSGRWENISMPSKVPGSSEQGSLNRQAGAHEQGESRFNSFRQNTGGGGGGNGGSWGGHEGGNRGGGSGNWGGGRSGGWHGR